MPSHIEGDEVNPSSLDNEELAQNRIRLFRKDAQWRDRWVDFDKYLRYYEGNPDEKYDQSRKGQMETDEQGFPRINLVQRSIDDTVFFVASNMPDAKLRADRTHLSGGGDPVEKDLQLRNTEMTEETMNAWADTILMDNKYKDKKEKVVFDAGIFGSGYLYTHIDSSMDVRNSYRIRALVEKLRDGREFTKDDAKKFRRLSERIAVDYIDARKVYFQHSIRDYDHDSMHRVTLYDTFDTETLRQRYSDVEKAEKIQPGTAPYYLEAGKRTEERRTGVITTYELEPFKDTYSEPRTGRQVSFLNVRMVKTVVAGSVLVERKEWTSTQGPIRLPVIPFVFRRSRRHPYGRSQAEDLAQSEKLINRVRALMFKSGLESVRPNGVSVFLKNLGPDDRTELENSFETGEPAFITGNMTGGDVTDIREIVMPHNFASSPLDPSLRQMMQIEMQAFEVNSSRGSSEDVGQARTGSAKRAQIAFNDRPKSLSVRALAGSAEKLYDNLFELMRTTFNNQRAVTIRKNGGGRRQVNINQDFQMNNVPVLDKKGDPITSPEEQSDGNPSGVITRDISMVLNSTQIDMQAQADNRGNLPSDMISRHQMLRQLESDQYIIHETARDFILDDQLKIADDINRENKQRGQREQLQQMVQQLQQQAQAGGGENLPEQQVASRPEETAPGQDAAQGPVPQDVALDDERVQREQQNQQ